VWTVGIHGSDGYGFVVTEVVLAESASDSRAFVLLIDSKFFLTARAFDVVTVGCNDLRGADFLERYKLGDLHAVFREFAIQQCTTGLAVDQIGGHVVSAGRAGSTLPGAPDSAWDVGRFRRILLHFENTAHDALLYAAVTDLTQNATNVAVR